MRIRKFTGSLPAEEIQLISQASDALAHPLRVELFRFIYTENRARRSVCNKDLVEHFGYLAGSLLNATQPGRICAIHLTQEPVFKGREGYVGLRDFRGDMIRCMEAAGW